MSVLTGTSTVEQTNQIWSFVAGRNGLHGDQGQEAGVGVWFGVGVPPNTLGSNGDLAVRTDGGAGTTIYQKRAGAWVATAA